MLPQGPSVRYCPCLSSQNSSCLISQTHKSWYQFNSDSHNTAAASPLNTAVLGITRRQQIPRCQRKPTLAFSSCLQGGVHSPCALFILIPTLGARPEAGSIGVGVMVSPTCSPEAVERYRVQIQPLRTLWPLEYGSGNHQWWHQSRYETREPHSQGRNRDDGLSTEGRPQI